MTASPATTPKHWYFEDFTQGLEIDLGQRHVTEKEIIAFATDFDPQPFHVDHAAAEKTIFKGVIASGWHTCGMMMRLVVDNLLKHSSSMGSPGLDSIRWLKPVRAGDTLQLTYQVKEVRPSTSKPDRGIVISVWSVRNQHGEVVTTVEGMACSAAVRQAKTMRDIAGIAGFQALAGQHVAVSDWLTITQQRIDTFADATDDHQWIHVDAERCARESPYGCTVAHGFLTLSLLPAMLQGALHMAGIRMAINYGLNKVRFPAPVPVGSRLRARLDILSVDNLPEGAQVNWAVTMEREGDPKPVCVAEFLMRCYP